MSAIWGMDGTEAGCATQPMSLRSCKREQGKALFWDIILAPICVYDISPNFVAFGSHSSLLQLPQYFDKAELEREIELFGRLNGADVVAAAVLQLCLAKFRH